MDSSKGLICRLQSLLLILVDLGLVGTLLFAPLFMGGRHPVGQLIFVSLVGATTVAWCARQCLVPEARWIRSGAELLLLAGLVLMIFQITPWPQPLLEKLSPTIGELLPLWTAQRVQIFRLGAWSQISLTPHATLGALTIYLAYSMLFLVSVQRIQSLGDLERLVRWLAFSVFAMAVLGLTQLLFGNGRFLWVYEDPFRDTKGVVKGPFFNENHFAHFLALGIGPLIWWWWRTNSNTRKVIGILERHVATVAWQKRSPSPRANSSPLSAVLPIALGIVCFAGLLTFSRGGIIAILLASVVSIFVFSRQGLLEKRTLAILAGMCAILGVALLIFGYEPLTEQLRTLEESRSLEELSQGRMALWQAHAKIIPKFILMGTGIGSHRQIYPTYMEENFAVTFEYGESGFLQLLVESGVVGLLLLFVGIVLSARWCLQPWFAKGKRETRYRQRSTDGLRKPGSRALQLRACTAALCGGIVASIVHSLFDFVWYIPACMSLTVITLACICRAGQLSCDSVGLRIVRPIWFALTAVTLTISTVMINIQLPASLAAPHWERYLRLVKKSKSHPEESQRLDDYHREINTLEEMLRYQPDHDEGHLRLAALYLLQFDLEQQQSPNPMPLAQIREAVWASPFPSAKERDQWLSIALGPNRQLLDQAQVHACRAIELCPLHGAAYVSLGEIAFLNGHIRSDQSEYVQQALRVRPFEGAVLIAAGSAAALAGDPVSALQFWRRAFHLNEDSRAQILEILAGQVPADVIVEQLSPDAQGMSQLFAYYRERNLDEEARRIGEKHSELLQHQAETEIGEPAARLWQEAYAVHCFLGNSTEALHCIRQAVKMMPADLEMHRTLARQLLAEQRFDEAIREIQWCRRRNPQDESLQKLHSEAHRLRLSSGEERAKLE